ncbi:MAG: hypothetical protein ACOYB4_05340 [Methyloceanibacter sp.]
MIEWVMFGALGFFLGCLLALMLAPPLWNRAVKLTTRKLEATMPMSLADIQADKDQLRAEYAIEIRKVEVALEKAKEKAIRELIEANKRRVELQGLEAEIVTAKNQIQEKDNANRVLEQTLKRRLPDLDNRLKAAKQALTELETINTELRGTVASQSEALKDARATLHNQRSDIDRLRASLEAGGGTSMRPSKVDSRYLGESQRLSAELSRAQEDLKRAQASVEENAMLRQEMAKLASQILSVTRNQESPPHTVVEVTQAFANFAEPPEPQEPEHEPESEPAWRGANGGNGEGRELQAEDEAAIGRETAEMPDAAPVEAEAEAEDEIMAEAVAAEAPPVMAEEAEESEAPEPKGLSKRFGRRRSKKRAGKGSGKSLTERLKGLVVDAPETHS